MGSRIQKQSRGSVDRNFNFDVSLSRIFKLHEKMTL